MKSAGKRSCWAPDFYKPCDYASIRLRSPLSVTACKAKSLTSRQTHSKSKSTEALQNKEFKPSGERYTLTELFFMEQTVTQLQCWGREEERMFAVEEHTFALGLKKNKGKEQHDTLMPESTTRLKKRSRDVVSTAECVFALSEFKRGRKMFQDALKIYWTWDKLSNGDKCDVLSLMREARWCMSMARLDLLRMA